MKELRKRIVNAFTEQDRIWADKVKEAIEAAKETGELDLVFLTDVIKETSLNRGSVEQCFNDFELRCKKARKVSQIFD